MNELPVILFPHSSLSEDGIKKILYLFGTLTIFQPWFMERPAPGGEKGHFKYLKILNPPINLRPGEDFKAILSEYRHWINQNQDKSYTEILKANQKMEIEENSAWEIRQMLRRMDQHTSRLENDHIIRWHLILHLAQEIEDQRLEADKMLTLLKEKNSPLKGIVEEVGEGKGIFEDLPQFESESVMDEYQLGQIFEAWFTLFGGYLKGNELLITLNQHVMDYVSELLKEYRGEDEGTHGSTVRFKLPDLSHYTKEEMAQIKEEYFSDGKFKEMENLIPELGNDPVVNLTKLDRLSKEIEISCPWELSRGTLNIIIKYLSPLSNSEYLKANRVLKHISNKTIILMNDTSYHE